MIAICPPAEDYSNLLGLHNVTIAPEVLDVVVHDRQGRRSLAKVVGWTLDNKPLFLAPNGRVSRLAGWTVQDVVIKETGHLIEDAHRSISMDSKADIG